MDLSLSPQDQAFREEVRTFLDENLSEDLREAGRKTGGVFAEMEAGLRWHKVLAKRGWSAPTWPVEHGGMGLSAAKQLLLTEEFERYGVARTNDHGIIMVGPLLILGRRLRYLQRDSQDRIADASALAGETLNAVQTVQAFTLEALHTSRFGAAIALLMRARSASSRSSSG